MTTPTDDLVSIRKQVDCYALKLRRAQFRVRDLEAELGQLPPCKRAQSAIATSKPRPDHSAQRLIDSYHALLQHYGQPPASPAKPPLPPRAASPPRRPKKPTAQDTSSLPPIAVRKLDSKRNPSQLLERLRSAIGLIEKVFETTDRDRIRTLYADLRANNAQLIARKRVLETEQRELARNRDRILAALSSKQDIARLANEAAHIHSHYEALLREKSSERAKFAAEKARLLEVMDKLSKSLQIDFVGDSVEENSNILVQKLEQRSFQLRRKPVVPLLQLGTLGNSKSFLPQTRTNRRAFSVLNSARVDDRKVVSEVVHEMVQFGKLLGNICVERFAPELHKFDVPLTLVSEPEFPNVPVQEPIDLKALFNRYRSNEGLLPLLIFEPSEIQRLDEQFLQFIASRDRAFQRIRSSFGLGTFVQELWPVLGQNPGVGFWIVRDFAEYVVEPSDLAQLFERIEFAIVDEVQKIPTTFDVAKTVPFIALTACLATFLDKSPDSCLVDSIVPIVLPIFPVLVGVWSKSIRSSVARCGFAGLFIIGKHVPTILETPFSVAQTFTSTFLAYIEFNLQFPSCIRAAVGFFIAAIRTLDEHDAMWHLAVVFHHFVRFICAPAIDPRVLVPLVAAMTALVANRHPRAIDQLLRFYFLEHLMTQFQLESFLGERRPSRVITRVSLAEIPKLQLPHDKPRCDVTPTTDGDSEKTTTDHPTNEFRTKVDQPKPQEEPPILEDDRPKFYLPLGQLKSDAQPERPKVVPSVEKPKLHLPLDNPKLHLPLDNPKLQLHLLPEPHQPVRTSISITDLQYFNQRRNLPVYLFPDLHVGMVQLFFATVINHNLHRLDERFCDPFPQVSRRPNVLFALQQHMEGNRGVADALLRIPDFIPARGDVETGRSTSRIEVSQDYRRLLRLTVPSLFHPDVYSGGTHIASGAFGAVMAVGRSAVKILEKSRNEFDNPHLIEVFTEVSILELCKGDRRVTQLEDYGCTVDSYYIVMELYPTTVKGWRRSEARPNLNVMLRLYREVLRCATVLVDRKINHFDIKCDNVMIDINGQPALADFGEAMSYTNEKNCLTLLNRGTEWIKSPEMLSIALNSAANPNYDRRKQAGAGPPSDVWSIGCLFYELLTGEFLFVDQDWSRFFLRITNPKEELLSQDVLAELPPGNRFPQFLRFVLQRNVGRRPNLPQVIGKFDEMFPEAKTGPLPHVRLPVLSESFEA